MLFYAAKGPRSRELAVNFLLAHAKDRSIHVNIFASRQFRMKSG